MRHLAKRSVSFCLILILFVSVLSACSGSDAYAATELLSLSVDEEGICTAEVTVSASDLSAGKGQTLAVYEIRPGETAEAAKKREPLCREKLSSHMELTFSAADGTRSRLYSAFLFVFSDGRVLHDGRYVDNIEAIARTDGAFPFSSSMKGLIGTEPSVAKLLGASHTVVEVSLASLSGGRDAILFGGVEYRISQAVVTALEGKLLEAARAGTQVTLRVIPDYLPSPDTLAAWTAYLCALSWQDAPLITAILLDGRTLTPEQAADTMRILYTSLVTSFSSGRVFLLSGERTLEGARDFFVAFEQALSAAGRMPWGAAISPLTDRNLTGGEGETPLTVFNMHELFYRLQNVKLSQQPSYLAVWDLRFSATDPSLQKMTYAYAYLLARSKGVDLLLTDATPGSVSSFWTDAGEARPIVDLFASMEEGLSERDLALGRELFGSTFSDLTPTSPSYEEVFGYARVAAPSGATQPLIDFSTDAHHVTLIASGKPVETANSTALSKQVLHTSLYEASNGSCGIRRVLPRAAMLLGSGELNTALLLQGTDAQTATVTLTLEGISRDSGRPLLYTTSMTLKTDEWQSVRFGISAFANRADEAHPCVITLTADTPLSDGEPLVLWMDSVTVLSPASPLRLVWQLVAVIGGVGVGFLLTYLIYRAAARKSRKSRRKEHSHEVL